MRRSRPTSAPRARRGVARATAARRPFLPAARAPGFLALLACLLLLVTLAAACGGDAKDQVTLQLNWFHEAEFAGYYAALEQGFYDEAGLDVTIVEGGPSFPAREQIFNSEATFAITSFGEQAEMVQTGEPAMAVMAAFQIPPLVIFSLTESAITEPADLVGKKVGVTTDYWANILEQTLSAAGVDPARVERVRVEPDALQRLYDGEIQAWLGYAQDEPIQAQTAGYPVTNIYPSDFGIGGYEGLLITLEQTIADDPDMVDRFVKASYEGWRYVLEHPDEAADILNTWAPDNGLEFQQLAVRAVAPLIDTPQVPVGWIDAERWEQLMGEAFDEARPGYTMQFSAATP